VRALRSMW